jgi:hypothetical protein
MKTELVRPFSKDKKIKIIGFRSEEDFEVENRWLWSEIILRRVYCKSCGGKEEIVFHRKDIPKLIRSLNYFAKEQDTKFEKIKKVRKKGR